MFCFALNPYFLFLANLQSNKRQNKIIKISENLKMTNILRAEFAERNEALLLCDRNIQHIYKNMLIKSGSKRH